MARELIHSGFFASYTRAQQVVSLFVHVVTHIANKVAMSQQQLVSGQLHVNNLILKAHKNMLEQPKNQRTFPIIQPMV